MSEFFRQCSFEKKLKGGGIRCQVSWIPEQYAKLGKYVKLKEGEDWEDGWKIVSVGARREKQDQIERSQDYKRQRKGSDIPRGKRLKGE